MCKNGKKIMPTGTKQQIHTSQLHGGSYGSSIPVKPAQYQINNWDPLQKWYPIMLIRKREI